eukprot:1720304-Rhodomonas_salina.3
MSHVSPRHAAVNAEDKSDIAMPAPDIACWICGTRAGGIYVSCRHCIANMCDERGLLPADQCHPRRVRPRPAIEVGEDRARCDARWSGGQKEEERRESGAHRWFLEVIFLQRVVVLELSARKDQPRLFRRQLILLPPSFFST